MNIKELDTGVVGTGRDIIFVDGKYYMLSRTPAKVCVSEDLENWTEYELNSYYLKPQNIAYGNGIFVITGMSGTSNSSWIYYSTNGENWTPVSINTPIATNSNAIKFINNKFVTLFGVYHYRSGKIDRTENYFYTSVDGSNWTRHQLIINSSKKLSMLDIDYHNGLYVAVGQNGSIYTSSDLDNWTSQNSENNYQLNGISYGKGQFIIVGDVGTILTSVDGKKWTSQNSETDEYLVRSRYSNGMYIAVGFNGIILQSIDGISWTIIDDSGGLTFGLCVNEDRFVITCDSYYDTGTIPLLYFDVSRNIVTVDNEDSSLFFFNKQLELLDIVDSFISMRWRRKYFEAGEFEIVLSVDDKIRNLVNTDVIVMRNNYTEAGIIETIQFSDNGTDEEVTISGRFLSSLFERRIVKNKINFSGNTIEGMNTIVNSMTPLTNQWETETVTMSSPHIDFQCTYKNVYEYLCKLSEYSNVGFRIVPNVSAKVYMFEVWKGLDRTVDQTENDRYAFSDDNFNIEQGTLVISDKGKVNWVLVGGVGEDANRVLVTVDDGKTGFDLYETFSDQKGLSNDGLSTSEYKAQLQSVGEAKLSEGVLKLEVTAMVQQDYKTKWDLGDVVNIKKDKWGICTSYRIIEVEEIIEDGKRTIYPTFGSPLSSAWDDE